MIRESVNSPKTIRQRFPNVSVRQKPFDKDSPMSRCTIFDEWFLANSHVGECLANDFWRTDILTNL